MTGQIWVRSIHISGSDGSLSLGHVGHQIKLKNLIGKTLLVIVLLESIDLLLYCIEGTGKFGEFTTRHRNLVILSILRPKFIHYLA